MRQDNGHYPVAPSGLRAGNATAPKAAPGAEALAELGDPEGVERRNTPNMTRAPQVVMCHKDYVPTKSRPRVVRRTVPESAMADAPQRQSPPTSLIGAVAALIVAVSTLVGVLAANHV